MRTRIANMLWGFFEAIGDNETTLISTKDDPPKHRLGVLRSVLTGRGLGALSFNVVEDNLSENERVLIQGKRSEPHANGPDDGGGEFYLGIQKPGQDGDGGMDDVLVVSHKDGFRSKLPIYAPNLGTNTPTAGDVLRSAGGRYRLHLQDDGNLVLYDEAFDGGGLPYWDTKTVRS